MLHSKKIGLFLVLFVACAAIGYACPHLESKVTTSTNYGPRIPCDGDLCPQPSVKDFTYTCPSDPGSGTYCHNPVMAIHQITTWYTCEDDECVKYEDTDMQNVGTETRVCP